MQFLGEEGAYEMLDTKPQVIEMMKPPRNALGICPKCLCLDPPKHNYGFFNCWRKRMEVPQGSQTPYHSTAKKRKSTSLTLP